MRILPGVILTAILGVGSVCAGDRKKDDPSQIGNRDVGKGLNFYSIEKEIALGRQLAQEVERQAKIVDDPLIAEYVNRIGQNLVRNSDAKVPFTFKVIEGQELNAFALPGGYIFVYTGLIRVADEEDEFAGALAHEIAHVAARHMTRQACRSRVAGIASLPLIFLGGVFYGASFLPQPFEALTRVNPIFYMISLVRYGFVGFTEVSIPLSLLALTAATAALFAANLRLFSKGYRLRS